MKKYERLITTLPTCSEDGITVAAPAFIRSDSPDVIRISAEHKNSYMFLDYFGVGRGGYSWINPALLQWAEEHEGFWEWENPSNIAFYFL
jgi:hypothetical protein